MGSVTLPPVRPAARHALWPAVGAGSMVGGGTAPPAASPLRYASSGNVVHNSKETMSKRGVQIRWPYVLGSDDLTELRLLLDNWNFAYGNNSMANPGNTLPIQGASLEIGGVVRPFAFAGLPGITLDDGGNDVLSDPLTPADFSLATFARGTTVYVKVLVMFDLAAASNLVNSSARAVSQSGARVAWFDPTVTTSSDVYAAGQWSATGTAVQSRTNGYVPKLVGRHVSATAKVWLGVGDSITQGTGDAGSTVRVAGLGWMSRAMRDASDTDASQVGYMSMAVHGSASTIFTVDARSATLAKYATHAVVMYGTNDIGSAGTGVTLTTMQTRLNAIYSLLRANGVQKILAGHLLPRTTSTDSWVTEANQAYSGGAGGWDAAGVPAQLNTWLTGQVGAAVDGVQHWPSIRGADDLKFVVTGAASYATTDGTHPTTATYTLMGGDVRAQMTAL